ncbi:MAG: S41 family peptidase [Bacteroidales bacterium]|nr:S41 family peptidase [Bacteroidales bacterium]
MKPRNTIPIQLFAACLIGLLLGKFCFSTTKEGVELSLFNGRLSKMQSIINIIDNKYVDQINIDSLNELLIPNILSRLDPHSTYIPAQNLNEAEKKLVGHFYGIGIEYFVFRDTVTVICVLPEGPAASANIKSGDKIIEIDGNNVTGSNSRNRASELLKGANGSTIRIGLQRYGIDSVFTTEITRGTIPVPSATASYMADSTTAYIKIESFGDNSYKEFTSRMEELKNQGAQNLIIDLRNNLGGRVEQAKRIASEILNYGDTIAFTIGRAKEIEDLYIDTTHHTICQDMQIMCLVDSRTASAAEILSAAIQDNDRGVIVGRRTFGKGLVQTPIQMPDGSQVRLTTYRYYTPSGRSLQKSYKNYDNDISIRYKNGELDSAAAFRIKDTTKYFTKNGRAVYAKSGVMPDVFVPIDRSTLHPIVYQIDSMMAIAHYVSTKYNMLNPETSQDYISALFDDEQATFDEFIAFAIRNGLKLDIRKNKKGLAECFATVMAMLKSEAYHIVGNEDKRMMYFNYNDHDIDAAFKLLGDPNKVNNILNPQQ